MNTWKLLTLSIILLPSLVLGRPIFIEMPEKLVANAKLVFVGRVKSVKPSNITTSLGAYGEVFRWQFIDVEVMEPFKGVHKNDIVQTATISFDEQSPIRAAIEPPGMLEPQTNDIFFFCLGATPETNLFASLKAPYDEDLSVFLLHPAETNRYYNYGGVQSMFIDSFSGFSTNEDFVRKMQSQQNQQYKLIFSLVDGSGHIQPANVQKFRQTFEHEIAHASSTNLVYLQWQTCTNLHGRVTEVPKGVKVDETK
jgi:hypothetical protein